MCTIVPSNHFGPIPGVPVGSLWKFRVQVSHNIMIILVVHLYTMVVMVPYRSS